MCKAIGFYSDEAAAANAPAANTDDKAELKGYEKFKDITLKVLGVILTLGAIFSFLNAAGLFSSFGLDASMMGGEIITYTVGAACSALVLAIVGRALCNKPKEEKRD